MRCYADGRRPMVDKGRWKCGAPAINLQMYSAITRGACFVLQQRQLAMYLCYWVPMVEQGAVGIAIAVSRTACNVGEHTRTLLEELVAMVTTFGSKPSFYFSNGVRDCRVGLRT